MSCIYSKPFTLKRSISVIFFVLSCFVFNNHAFSEGKTKITGHYYVAKDNTYEKYNDKIQWEITNVTEWNKFLKKLKTMPKDQEKNNPMGLKQPEVIHFNVLNSDQISGHDLFISKSGIQQFSRMPMDQYFIGSSELRAFLDTELSLNPGYDVTTGKVDIHTPGIVVIFRGSQHLKNPYWVIAPTDKTVLQKYKTLINSLKTWKKNTSQFDEDSNDIPDDELYESEGSYILYLNYPGAPQEYIVVTKDAAVRGTNVQPQYNYYKDTMGYFSMFKRQAEDNLAATKAVEEAPEVKQKKEIIKGNLF